MGGLYGFINKKKSFKSEELINKMRRSLTHQEWHSDEIVIKENYAFGRKGVVPSYFQPVYRADYKSFIMLDGDILAINNSDISHNETYSEKIAKDILDISDDLSSELPRMLEGDFNILLADLKNDTFSLINDIFGLRHLFYYDDDNIFIFATEIEAILQYPDIDRGLNHASISDYFYHGTLIHNNTYFQKIHLLPPASHLIIEKGALTVRKYWSPDYTEDRVDVSYDDFIDEGYELWKNAIHKRIKGKDSIAIPLSGGLDSRLLVAFTMMKNSNVFAFTHDDRKGDEHRIAKRVVEYFSIPEYRLYQFDGNSILNNLEEAVRLKGGMVQHGAILMDMAKEMKNQYDIFLNGSFAMGLSFTSHYIKEDEIEGKFSLEEKISRISKRCGDRHFGQLSQSMLKPDFLAKIKADKGISIQRGLEDFQQFSDRFHKQKDLFLIQTLKRRRGVGIDIWRYFVNDVLPLADYDMFKFYLRFPVKYKLNREFHYEIIRRKFPDLARIEYQRTGVDLFSQPSKYIELKRKYFPLAAYYIGRASLGKIHIINKMSFDNSNVWYRKHRKLQDYFHEILLDSQTDRRGYFDLKALEKLLEHQKKGGDCYNLIAQMVEFEITCRLFFD